MYNFHVSVHARPPGAAAGPTVRLRGMDLATVDLPRGEASVPFSISFEDLAGALAELPQMFLEPDGAFVWTSPADVPVWQLEGVLYDRAGRVMHVELKGSCSAAEFVRLLSALAQPAGSLMFQLIREGVYLDETIFRQYAAR